MSTFRAQSKEIRDKLRIIHTTRKVPPHPVVAHPRVPSKFQEKVRQAFIDISASEEGEKLLEKIPMQQAVPVCKESFHPLRDMDLENYLVKSDE